MEISSKADIVAERGTSIFENQIKERVAGLNPEAFLAIDVNTGDFEVSDDDVQIFRTLRARRPDAVIFLRCIGDESAYFMGGGA